MNSTVSLILIILVACLTGVAIILKCVEIYKKKKLKGMKKDDSNIE